MVTTTERSTVDSNRELIKRIVGSSVFQKAPRLRELLLFVADCTLTGRLEDAREQSISERVFNRKSSYAAQDSIVRAEARNLRKRLETYFATEGENEPVVVLMPKGGYTLVFQARLDDLSASTVPVEEAARPATLVSANEAHGVLQELRRYRYICLILAVLVLMAGSVAGFAMLRNSALRAELNPPEHGLPFSSLFGNGKDTLIITSDTALLQVYAEAKRGVTIDEYITRSYPNLPGTFSPTMVRRGEYTDGQEVAIAESILQRNAPFLAHTFLRSGHQVQLTDFKKHNVILLGSKLSNPWAALYDDKLNFQVALDLQTLDITFRNMSPRRDEAAVYLCCENNRSYARIGFLPNTSGSAPALLIAGTTAESTAAAGEFVVDEARMSQALRNIGIDPAGSAHYFELLLKVTAFVGGATQAEVVASRVDSALKRPSPKNDSSH